MKELRCPVCLGEKGSIRFITTETRAKYLTADGAAPIIAGTAGWIGGPDETTARIDIEGGCGHNWSILIRQSDLRIRYRVYQDEQNPEGGPFMPRRQPNGGQLAANREEVVPDHNPDEETENKTEAPVNDAGAAPPQGFLPGGFEQEAITPEPAPSKKDGWSEEKKAVARERMQALWAKARAEGRERPGGPIREKPE